MNSIANREQSIFNQSVDSIIKNIAIPPCPELLLSLQKEMSKVDFSFEKISNIIQKDPGITAAVLKTVNSPFYGLSQKIGTVQQAVSFIGSAQIINLVSGFLLRNSFAKSSIPLTRFWDVSNKRSFCMYQLAKHLRNVPVDQAQCFGLFCDIGIPLLIQSKKQVYFDILREANLDIHAKFTEVEQKHLGTDHAILGSIMSRSWGVSPNICTAIVYHHDYSVFEEAGFNPQVLAMLALNALSELAIQRYSLLNENNEWSKFKYVVMNYLDWNDDDVEDAVDFLIKSLSNEESLISL